MNKSQPSFTSRPESDTNLSEWDSEADIKPGCCPLFFKCFTVGQGKESSEEIVNKDAKEFDYVVEKLVVQRVPFVLVAIDEKQFADKCNSMKGFVDTIKEGHATRKTRNSIEELNDGPATLKKTNPMLTNTASETQSLLYYSDRLNQDMLPPLNTSASNERRKTHVSSDDYHSRITQLLNAMSSLHPDLKENERPPKNPRPMNMTKDRELSTRISLDILQNKNNENTISDGLKIQTSFQESFLGQKEFGMVNLLGSNSKIQTPHASSTNTDFSCATIRWRIVLRRKN